MIGVPAGGVTPVWQGPIGYTVVGGPVHPDRPTTDSHRSSPPALHEAPDLWAAEWRASRHHGRAPLTHRGCPQRPDRLRCSTRTARRTRRAVPGRTPRTG